MNGYEGFTNQGFQDIPEELSISYIKPTTRITKSKEYGLDTIDPYEVKNETAHISLSSQKGYTTEESAAKDNDTPEISGRKNETTETFGKEIDPTELPLDENDDSSSAYDIDNKGQAIPIDILFCYYLYIRNMMKNSQLGPIFQNHYEKWLILLALAVVSILVVLVYFGFELYYCDCTSRIILKRLGEVQAEKLKLLKAIQLLQFVQTDEDMFVFQPK